MTIKDRLLIGIVTMGRVDRPRDLRAYAQTDQHNLTHVLWGLQKQGLITFRETKSSTLTMLTAIKPTAKGISRVRSLEK